MMKSKDYCMKKNRANIFTVINRRHKPEACSELYQTSKKKVNSF